MRPIGAEAEEAWFDEQFSLEEGEMRDLGFTEESSGADQGSRTDEIEEISFEEELEEFLDLGIESSAELLVDTQEDGVQGEEGIFFEGSGMDPLGATQEDLASPDVEEGPSAKVNAPGGDLEHTDELEAKTLLDLGQEAEAFFEDEIALAEAPQRSIETSTEVVFGSQHDDPLVEDKRPLEGGSSNTEIEEVQEPGYTGRD